jgi:WhiB family redox-sensing transcriptional regulator
MMTTDATDWRAASACLSADPELFFPMPRGAQSERQTRAALQVCAGCAVRQQCLEFAMRAPEMNGIWGGTTPEERTRARRRAMRRRHDTRAWQASEGARAS